MKKYICFVIISLSTLSLSAQESSDLGAAPFLTIPADARTAAMGMAGAALDQGAFSVFNNASAVLFSEENIGAGYTFSPWQRDWASGSNMHSVGAFYNIDSKNGISLGFRHFKNFDSEYYDNNGNFIGKDTPKDFAIDLAYSRMIIDNLAASVNARFISSNLGDMAGMDKANAVAFDIGLTYKRAINSMDGADWSVALHASNLGTKIKYDTRSYELPGRIKLGGGVGLPFSENHKLSLALDLSYQIIPSSAELFEGGIGAEYNFLKYGNIRAGYHLGDKNKGFGNFATVGAGVQYSMVKVDFAYWITESDSPLKNTFCATVGVYFGCK